jgi:hypothetical protein
VKDLWLLAIASEAQRHKGNSGIGRQHSEIGRQHLMLIMCVQAASGYYLPSFLYDVPINFPRLILIVSFV